MSHSSAEVLAAEHFVIATGSRPYHPPDVDFNHPRVLDSDSVLRLGHTPRSITIYGAGVIGCEYASVFTSLDVKVNLVDTRARRLSYLQAHLRLDASRAPVEELVERILDWLGY